MPFLGFLSFDLEEVKDNHVVMLLDSFKILRKIEDKFGILKMHLTSFILTKENSLLLKPRHFLHCLDSSWDGRKVTIETLRFRDCSNIFLEPIAYIYRMWGKGNLYQTYLKKMHHVKFRNQEYLHLECQINLYFTAKYLL